jgi:hypothetical protein
MSTDELISSNIADEDVVKLVSGSSDRKGLCWQGIIERKILQMLAQDIVGRTTNQVRALAGRLDDCLLLTVNNVGIVTGATNEEVVSETRHVLTELPASPNTISWNDEITSVGHQNVIARTANENVASCLVDEPPFDGAEQAAHQHIVAGSSIKNVIRRVADDEIV